MKASQERLTEADVILELERLSEIDGDSVSSARVILTILSALNSDSIALLHIEDTFVTYLLSGIKSEIFAKVSVTDSIRFEFIYTLYPETILDFSEFVHSRPNE